MQLCSNLTNGVKYAIGINFLPTGWEVAYNHYVGRLGMRLPETAALLKQNYPDQYSFCWCARGLHQGCVHNMLVVAPARAHRGAVVPSIKLASWPPAAEAHSLGGRCTALHAPPCKLDHAPS